MKVDVEHQRCPEVSYGPRFSRGLWTPEFLRSMENYTRQLILTVISKPYFIVAPGDYPSMDVPK